MLFATEKAVRRRRPGEDPDVRQARRGAEHRAVFTDATLSGALYFMTPLSLPYALESADPALAEAVEGEAPRKMMQAP